MPTLKTRAKLLCARNSRLIDGLRFCAVILCAIVGTGLIVSALAGISHKETLAEVKASNAQYLAEIQRLHEQALREKDARLADKDAIIKALTDVAGDAAAKAETAASTSERAAKTANQAIKELRDPTPASPPPAPVAPPSWHDGP